MKTARIVLTVSACACLAGSALAWDEPKPPAAAKAVPAAAPSKVVRVHLMDGTVISGELSVNEVMVATDFGKLTVPITRIVSITPGLDSHPKLVARIDALIKDLGDKDTAKVQSAKRELLAFGPKARSVLRPHANDANATRKTQVAAMLKQLDELAAGQASLDEGKAAEWNRKDVVVTPKFTITGKVSPDNFTIKSKYGPLVVSLGDVQKASRSVGDGPQTFRKLVAVMGNNIIQRSFKSSGLRLEKGDKVTIGADGTIVMSPWGSSVTVGPDGAQNYSYYDSAKRIYGGTLAGRIGASGELFRIGSKHTFVAKKSGMLYFAVGMNNSYSSSGYSYPGQYNVKVRVVRNGDK